MGEKSASMHHWPRASYSPPPLPQLGPPPPDVPLPPYEDEPPPPYEEVLKDGPHFRRSHLEDLTGVQDRKDCMVGCNQNGDVSDEAGLSSLPTYESAILAEFAANAARAGGHVVSGGPMLPASNRNIIEPVISGLPPYEPALPEKKPSAPNADSLEYVPTEPASYRPNSSTNRRLSTPRLRANSALTMGSDGRACYRCAVCQMEFISQINYHQHLLSHQDESVQFPSCRPSMFHNANNNATRNDCGGGGNNRSANTTHGTSSSNRVDNNSGSTYTCSVCQKRYNHSFSLLRHMAYVHQETPELTARDYFYVLATNTTPLRPF